LEALKPNLPGSSLYESTEASYFSLQEADLEPACIIRPQSSQDVANAMSIIAGIPECRFAVKGGGHSPIPGFANIQDGITFDMSNLSAIHADHDTSVARVGAGAISVDVYKALEPLGLAVTAGRNGHVGVAGFLLGGGISHFTTDRGWGCHNVVNYEVP
jgi:FAD/FMN-containing dehydrogenase